MSLMRAILGGSGAAPPPIKHGLNFFTDAIELVPSAYAAYVDVDVSDYVPPYATGVIVEINEYTGSWTKKAYLRKNGSTDDGYAWNKSRVQKYGHVFYIVGVDANKVFEAKIQDTALKMWLLGYTDDHVTLFTNRIDVTTGGLSTWVDTDVSAHVPAGATGVILQIANENGSQATYCLRKKGSIDLPSVNEEEICTYETHMVMRGVDSNRVFQQWRETANIKIYLCGYTMEPVYFITNRFGYGTITVDGTWRDKDVSTGLQYPLPSNTHGIFLDVWAHNISAFIAFRVKGSTDDRSGQSRHTSYTKVPQFAGCDENAIQQYNLERIGAGINPVPLVYGYCTEA